MRENKGFFCSHLPSIPLMWGTAFDPGLSTTKEKPLKKNTPRWNANSVTLFLTRALLAVFWAVAFNLIIRYRYSVQIFLTSLSTFTLPRCGILKPESCLQPICEESKTYVARLTQKLTQETFHVRDWSEVQFASTVAEIVACEYIQPPPIRSASERRLYSKTTVIGKYSLLVCDFYHCQFIILKCYYCRWWFLFLIFYVT